MQPAIVGSSSFGILWTNTYNAKERWYAKPLVYTPPGQKQLVFTASNMNIIRTVDAVTGAPIKDRQVQPPFLQSDIGCTDMPNYIGIAGTPIIDPATDTVYFFAKGYKNNAASGGVANGIYKFYAVNIRDLTDRPGFPILIDGHNADNDPARYFIGGTVLQRPSLALVNGIVYGTFGGHCDLFNYTGMIAGVSTTAGKGVTSLYAMEASPYAPDVVSDIMVQKGGKAGIWMSGMAPATDGSRIFVVTGNGMGHENRDTPASGRHPLSTLDEVVANFDVSSGSNIKLQDYFEPYEYIGMDAGDRDLGSGGVALLDPAVFKGTNGVSRLGVTIGKNGKAYIMNADNLGGFKLGPGATDNLVQTIIADNAVFGGAGSYPLEGGYIYFTPVGSATIAYKLGLDQNGGPLFTKVGQTADVSAGRVGVGVPTITSYKGQAGTGILWVTDVDAGLKAYKAVPQNGVLVRINIPPTGGLNKFQRPAFGDGRLYVTDSKGRLLCLGSPVSLPLNCTSPLDFGDVTFGSAKTLQTFQVSNSSLPKGSLAAGDTFQFPVTWNLTKEGVKDDAGASFGAVSPGVKTSSLVISTTNAVAQYSNSLPITLQGNEISSAPFLSVSPAEVDFGGIVVGSPGAATGLDSSFILANIGASPLKILGYGYTSGDFDDDDDADGGAGFTNVTQQGQNMIIGNGFTSSDLPAVGSILAAGQSLTVPINFKSTKVGNYQNLFQVWTNGGNKNVLFTGSATTAPIAELAVETVEHGWNVNGVMDFGDVVAGTVVTRRIRLCNKGGSALLITKSKPPIDAELRAENPTSDLHEGQSIPIGECAYGPVDIAAAPEAANVASHDVSNVWILNTDDLTFGVHDVEIKATIVSRQLGPKYDNGTARYTYLGCYLDIPRQMQKNYNLGQANENGVCQQKCLANGYRFASTEYSIECWCGNNPPNATQFTSFDGINNFDDIKHRINDLVINLDDQSYNLINDRINYHNVDINELHFDFYDRYHFDHRINDYFVNLNNVINYNIQTDNLVNFNNCISQYHLIASTLSIYPVNFKYADDKMTVASCIAYCKGKGTTYAGLEYHRECYCGNTIAPDAVANAQVCVDTCMGNSTEYCGGSNAMNVYKAVTPSSPTTTTSKSSTSSTTSTTSTTSPTSPTATTSKTATSSTPTTSSTLVTTTSPRPSSTLPSPTASATSGFYALGCYAEPPAPTKKPMQQLLSSPDMSVEYCISIAKARLSHWLGVRQGMLGCDKRADKPDKLGGQPGV
ncbi:MAG: hypothetical protein Q9190_004833 [Brigantiaea leucoxantha]